MKKEIFARFLVILLILIAVTIPVVGRAIFSKNKSNAVELDARIVENGGWSMGRIEATVGKPLYLRITSEDVVHGFAVGEYAMDQLEVLPGEFTELALTFDKPGSYTFFCTRWCGPNHTKMRGTIVVSGETIPQP